MFVPAVSRPAKSRARWLPLLRALVAGCVSLAGAGVGAQALPVVPALDLDRYAGTWHEIARYPNWFERNCAREVTATYTRNDDGTIGVVNACRRQDGSMLSADGLARVVAPAQLQVRFAPAWLGFLPFVWGDYWVIDLAPDYSYSVVGDPSRRYLWILARSPAIDESAYRRITERLPALGYDPAKLIRNPAPGEAAPTPSPD